MTTIELVHRDPKELKNYPLNISLYREHIDEDFVSSIREKGIQSPLTVCKSTNPLLNDFIVMGRRRRIAALTCKMKTVPCIVWECDDPIEFEERLILDNIRNETTVEERARMYEGLLRIETEKAARRQKAGKKPSPDLTSILTQGLDATKQGKTEREPEAAEASAKQVGLSKNTAKKAIEVVHAADKLESEGNPKAAAEVRDTLNNGTVAAAVRKVAEVTAPSPQPPSEDQQHSKEIDRLTAKLTGLLSQAEKFAGELFVAIDQKKKTSPAFANRHAKFANLLRKFSDTLDPCLQGAGVIETAWVAARKQVDE
jgi:ParB/RepB/Spo0J family partition protein